jgi:hypothetical protein
VSAWEYCSKAEALLAENQFLEPAEIADELVDAGYVLAANRDAVAEEIAAHDTVYRREDFDADCKCGKWLEDDQWEWPDHMGDVLDQWITEAGRAGRHPMPKPEVAHTASPAAPVSGPVPSEMCGYMKTGMYWGPQDYIDALMGGGTPAVPFVEDMSPWTIRPIAGDIHVES